VLAGDSERERAAATLREAFVGGRLTLDELSSRTEVVLAARSRRELRGALAGLPAGLELAAQARRLARSAARGMVLVVFTGAYLAFSFTLLVVLALTLVLHGASVPVLAAFLVVWLVPTFLLSRLWHRKEE
jgi:hypothetical protein